MKRHIRITLFMLIFFTLTGCKKDNEQGSQINGTANISVSLGKSTFNAIKEVELKGSTGQLRHKDSSEESQSTFISLGSGFTLSLNLSIEKEEDETYSNKKLASNGKKASIERETLDQGIRYKLLVFSSEGKYLTEREYVSGQESLTSPLELDGGISYDFVAYSLGNPGSLPQVTFTDNNNKTLQTASLIGISGSSDFMYFKKSFIPIGGKENNLSIILKHQFSEVTTTLDASQTGYEITNLTAAFDSHFALSDIALSNGVNTRKGNQGAISIAFSNLGKSTAIGSPTILNSETASAKLILSSITIGPLNKTNIIAAQNLSIVPGVKYNLKLNVNPADTIFTEGGQSLARIGGKVWMRYNLGVNQTNYPDPDLTSPTNGGLIGNYYQWGSNKIEATGFTGSGSIPGWFTNRESTGNYWNRGTEENPVKGVNDPCPSGFRIPTITEFRHLSNSTIQYNVNDNSWNTSSASNYGSIKVFQSKSNKNVKLSFPGAGYRADRDGALLNRGVYGAYWSSTLRSTTGNTNLRNMLLNKTSVDLSSGAQSAGFAENIRCIRE